MLGREVMTQKATFEVYMKPALKISTNVDQWEG